MLLSRKKRIFHFLTSKRLFIITICKYFFYCSFIAYSALCWHHFQKISKYSSFQKNTSCRRSKKLLPLFTKMGKTSCSQSEKINSIFIFNFKKRLFSSLQTVNKDGHMRNKRAFLLKHNLYVLWVILWTLGTSFNNQEKHYLWHFLLHSHPLVAYLRYFFHRWIKEEKTV